MVIGKKQRDYRQKLAAQFLILSALSFFVFSVCLFFQLDSAGRQLPLSDSHSSSFRTTRIRERTEVRCTQVLRPPGISVR